MGNVSYPDDPQWNVYNFKKNTSIRIILRNYFPLVHPMHLHGHNFWVLAEGNGEWDGTITNPPNPQRRDTQLMVSGTPDVPSYVVLQWNADNPGVWPLHCHVVVHVSAGLYINVLVCCFSNSERAELTCTTTGTAGSYHRPTDPIGDGTDLP